MIFEEQLKAAAQEAGEALLDSLPERDRCVHRFSPRFERRMKGLLQKYSRPAALRRVAGFLLALLLGGTIWLSVDAEAKGVAMGWFRQAVESAFVYRFAGSAESVDRNVKYAPTWLPEDWVEITKIENDGGVITLYENANEQICRFSYYYNGVASAPTIVTEGKQIQVAVGEYQADFYDAEGLDESSTLVWSNPEYDVLFVLSAYLDQEDFVKIAENVAIKK